MSETEDVALGDFVNGAPVVDATPVGSPHVDAVLAKFAAKQAEAKATAPAEPAPAAPEVNPDNLEPVDLTSPAEPEAEPAAEPPPEPPPAVSEEHAATIEKYTELIKTVEAEREQLSKQRERLDYIDAMESDFRVSPGQAIADFARKAFGDNDAAYRESLADAISELTALSLDAKLDTDTRVRQLDRKVRENENRLKLQQVKREQEEQARALRQEVEQSRAILGQALGSLTNEYPFLLAEDDAASLILSIGEKEFKQTGKARHWQQIAADLNKDLETRHAAKLSRLEKLKGLKPASQNTTNEIKSDTAKSVPRTLGTKAASEPAETPGEPQRAKDFNSHVEGVMKRFAQQRRMTTT